MVVSGIVVEDFVVMQSNRRSFLRGLASFAGAVSAQTAYAQHVHPAPADAAVPPRADRPVPPQRLGPGVVPVVSPDIPDMPWRLENGTKVFDIRVEHVRTELVPGRVLDGWGFNGSIPGPTIQVSEGDRVRLNVENGLPEPFSMHWHGLEIPNNMDGMPGISQDAIPPGGRFVYEFTLKQNGTFFYHSHMAMQEMMGPIGLFIIHPRRAHTPRVDRDFGIVLQEWALLPNNTIPNSLAMEFNWLTLNGKAGSRHDAAGREAGRASEDSSGQPRDGSSPDAHSRSSVLRHRHRRRPHPIDRARAREHRARRRGAGA